MSYLGISGGGNAAENQYTSGGYFNQPHYMAIGTVAMGLQSGQLYEVFTDGGAGSRVTAIFLGQGRGRLGVSEAGGILPGERVLVAVPFASAIPAVIVAKLDYAKDPAYRAPCNQLTYPQVSGFEPEKRMSGQMTTDYPRLRNFTTGLPDALDGEWHQHNMFGAGMGVELFRSYIRGGPASGVFCYSEDQHTRIMGARLEFMSFAGTLEDDPGDGGAGATVKIDKRWFFAGDQLEGWQSQIIEVTGPAYGGYQFYLTYPDGVNGSRVTAKVDEEEEEEGEEEEEPGGPGNETDPNDENAEGGGGDEEEPQEAEIDPGESRVAMIHEYRGQDGNYVLSAASSLTFQKTLQIPVPVDLIEAQERANRDLRLRLELEEDEDDEDDDDETVEGADCGCDACPLTADPAVPGVEKDEDEEEEEPGEGGGGGGGGGGDEEEEEDEEECEQDPNATRFDSNASPNPLAFAMNARGLADRIVLWGATGGFENNCGRWIFGEKPERIYGGRSADELLWDPSVAMWKCMPQTIKLAIKPDGSSKRFYFGRALIAITEDGSIVLQDGQGSEIMMSGGNIYMAANHDIVRTAGRNALDIAGRDAAVRAGRHMDINANEGRLTAMSAGQATLVGGRDGHGGVLIESQGNGQQSNATGENPATSGGVVVRSRQYIGISAPNVTVRCKGGGYSGTRNGAGMLYIDTTFGTLWRADDTGAIGGLGEEVWAKFGDSAAQGNGFRFGNRRFHVDLEARFERNLVHRTLRRCSGQPNMGTKHMGPLQNSIIAAMEGWIDDPTSPVNMGASFAAKWLTSNQYNLDSSTYFQIPEPEWQRRARGRLDASSSALKAVMADQPVEGTSPLPGNERWTGDGMATVEYSVPDFNGRPSVNLSVSNESLDSGLLKGI